MNTVKNLILTNPLPASITAVVAALFLVGAVVFVLAVRQANRNDP